VRAAIHVLLFSRLSDRERLHISHMPTVVEKEREGKGGKKEKLIVLLRYSSLSIPFERSLRDLAPL